jgi:pentatricopeptide repeat protein
MLRTSQKALSKALSPYAQALKQVALKGSVAVGPSAKEMEIEMYRKGTLPADYRPPVQGKWDDTIERWAYAWQFPAEEEYDDTVASVERNGSAMQQLLEFGDRLVSSPPSSTPRSGRSSSLYAPLDAGNSKQSQQQPILAASQKYEALEDDIKSLTSAVETETRPVMAVEEFSRETNIPIAYLDDESERTNASKELSVILAGAGLDLTEEGLVVALSALARQHCYDAAQAIFRFACEVGLGPNAEMYKALMQHFSSTGSVNESMALVEEMKRNGITPRIGNWHELMRTFHNARDYSAVSHIVDNMKMYANIEPNEVTFALQLRALSKDTSKVNSLAESVQLFDQMENVYGYIAARPHYDALMFSLSQSPVAEMRLRCEELAQKMDLMGIPWNATTYLNLIRSAQVVGDVEGVEKYLAKMRDERIPVNMMHLSWAIQAHVQHLIRANYEKMKESNADIYASWLDHMNICFGIYELVVRRGWEMQTPFVNALLRLCCQTTILSIEHLPENTIAVGKFEEQANKIWNDTFDEWHLKKDVYSYECYIALLAHQQRIDEAEKLFQQMVLQEDLVPSRRTYECLIFMHLSSGEEGGAARALHYLEAMENARIPVRASLLKKIVRVNNAAGYKRDMKRRARRIMQAREEYLARKQEGVDFPLQPGPTPSPPTESETADVAAPLPVPVNTTLAWWEKWKKNTISKHELFEEENADGTPKGETFEEKNAALAKMGIDSAFKTPADVPALDKQKLLPKIRREEGEVTGSLWALDGGELAYPKDGGGPEGWGVRLWRERALLKKEFQAALDGKADVPAFSEMGKAVRVAGDQLDIEESKASTPGELADWRRYPQHRYDDGHAKPASEMAHAVSPSAELVWQGEQRDSLAPYKSDAEIALESDNTFYSQMQAEAASKTDALVSVLKNKEENSVELVGRGATRKSKYDYLEKWREMYRHGTLEAPETPLLRFGRSPEDHHDSLAETVREWYQRNRKSPATEAQLRRWEAEEARDVDARVAKKALHQNKRRRAHRRK